MIRAAEKQRQQAGNRPFVPRALLQGVSVGS